MTVKPHQTLYTKFSHWKFANGVRWNVVCGDGKRVGLFGARHGVDQIRPYSANHTVDVLVVDYLPVILSWAPYNNNK